MEGFEKAQNFDRNQKKVLFPHRVPHGEPLEAWPLGSFSSPKKVNLGKSLTMLQLISSWQERMCSLPLPAGFYKSMAAKWLALRMALEKPWLPVSCDYLCHSGNSRDPFTPMEGGWELCLHSKAALKKSNSNLNKQNKTKQFNSSLRGGTDFN